jgi:hypothetical protein
MAVLVNSLGSYTLLGTLPFPAAAGVASKRKGSGHVTAANENR